MSIYKYDKIINKEIENQYIYIIIAISRNCKRPQVHKRKVKTLDKANNLCEAKRLVSKYRIIYGNNWIIRYKKKYNGQKIIKDQKN